MDSYELLMPLQDSDFCTVYTAIKKMNKKFETVIIKSYKNKRKFKKSSESNKDIIYLSNNVQGLCKILDIIKLDYCFNVIIEYIPGITLHKYIYEMKHTADEIYIIIRELLMILVRLHDTSVIHMDIKPENIIVNPKKNFKTWVIDLGYASKKKCEYKMNGTPIYMAPEIFLETGYTNNIDVYSFALVLYELMESKHFIDNILDEEEQDDIPKILSVMRDGFSNVTKYCNSFLWNDKYKTILIKGLYKNGKKRPCAANVYNYFIGVYDKLTNYCEICDI